MAFDAVAVAGACVYRAVVRCARARCVGRCVRLYVGM